MTATCETCRHFVPYPGTTFDDGHHEPSERGACVIRSVPTDEFPRRMRDDRCAEHAAKEIGCQTTNTTEQGAYKSSLDSSSARSSQSSEPPSSGTSRDSSSGSEAIADELWNRLRFAVNDPGGTLEAVLRAARALLAEHDREGR